MTMKGHRHKDAGSNKVLFTQVNLNIERSRGIRVRSDEREGSSPDLQPGRYRINPAINQPRVVKWERNLLGVGRVKGKPREKKE